MESESLLNSNSKITLLASESIIHVNGTETTCIAGGGEICIKNTFRQHNETIADFLVLHNEKKEMNVMFCCITNLPVEG